MNRLFDTSDFPARWHCGNWTDLHGWTHILSDIAIFAAYFTIPAVLILFVRRRTDLPFPRVFWLFGLFIAACGTTHLIEAIIFWQPVYRFSAVVKAVTAAVSWCTVIALIPTIGQALRYRSPDAIEAEAELMRSNQELKRFAYVASHDLKAPLRAIQNLAEWLEEDLADVASGETKKHLSLLQRRVDRMGSLLDGLLDYARVGRTNENIETLFPSRVVSEIVELIDPPNTVSIRAKENMPPIQTARAPFQQVMLNLISNAVKHGGPNVLIKISVSDEHDYFSYSVSDTGPGIDPVHHAKIFEIFCTLQARDEVESSGVGLAIVKKVVESHGGQISVESSPGNGATFKFTWPKASAGCADPSVIDSEPAFHNAQ